MTDSGEGIPVGSSSWFDYDKTSGTGTTMKAEADNCKNAPAGEGRQLDGDRTSPNKDDRDWSY
jgi:hypothetical protein